MAITVGDIEGASKTKKRKEISQYDLGENNPERSRVHSRYLARDRLVGAAEKTSWLSHVKHTEEHNSYYKTAAGQC